MDGDEHVGASEDRSDLTGEMIAYGYQAKGDLSDDIAVYTVNPQGHIVKEVWLKSPYLGIIHDIAITQKYVLIPVISRTTSLERLKSGEPMWEWKGSLPTMVGVLPRDGEAKDVRWFKGPSRNTLHFLNASDGDNKITMELPVSDEERSPSHIKRWTFDMNSKNDAFGEEVVSTLERRARAHGRSLSVAAVPLRLRRPQRRRAAVRHGRGRQSRGPRDEHVQAFRSAESHGAGKHVLRRQTAELAGVRLRAAQRQHGGGRRLHHGRREQLRRDGVASCTSSTRSAWRRARSRS